MLPVVFLLLLDSTFSDGNNWKQMAPEGGGGRRSVLLANYRLSTGLV